MDITTLRIISTVVSFAIFVGIVLWAIDRKKSRRFNEAAQLPFQDD